jgi:hypothetical protein
MGTEDNAVEKNPTDHIENVEVTKEAKLAAQAEHQTTLWQALKSNKKAAIWSAIISLTIIMEGYDIGITLLCCIFTTKKRLLMQTIRPYLPIFRISILREAVWTLGSDD